MKISLRIKRLLSNRKMTGKEDYVSTSKEDYVSTSKEDYVSTNKQQTENDEEPKTMNKCICGFSFLEKYFHFVFN